MSGRFCKKMMEHLGESKKRIRRGRPRGIGGRRSWKKKGI